MGRAMLNDHNSVPGVADERPCSTIQRYTSVTYKRPSLSTVMPIGLVNGVVVSVMAAICAPATAAVIAAKARMTLLY